MTAIETAEMNALRRELDWLMQSEAVRSMAEKDEHGKHKHNIKGLDNCILTLHARAASAEAKCKTMGAELQTIRAENVYLRRKIEAMVDPAQTSPVQGEVASGVSRKPDDGGVVDPSEEAEEKQFPIFNGKYSVLGAGLGKKPSLTGGI